MNSVKSGSGAVRLLSGKVTKVIKKIEEHCMLKQNIVLQTYRFWTVGLAYSEPFDAFLTELRTRAEACNFQEKERMIRDKIVFTVTGKVQELLLRESEKLTLNRAIDTARSYEVSLKQAKEMSGAAAISPQKVNKVSKAQQKKNANSTPAKPAAVGAYGNSRQPKLSSTGKHKSCAIVETSTSLAETTVQPGEKLAQHVEDETTARLDVNHTKCSKSTTRLMMTMTVNGLRQSIKITGQIYLLH